MGTYQGDETTGFQSPAQDYIEPVIDLAALLDLRRPGLYRYAKAGIVLVDLYQAHELPAADMFATRDPEKSARVMAALDALNGRFGRDAVRPGGLIAKPASWSMRRGNLSPCYTTRIEDVMQVQS